jgi:hypothetical protein
MSNLAKVVVQLRQQRDQAQKKVEQLDQALAALGSVDGLRSRGRSSQKVGRKGRTMSAAARKRNCSGATCALGEMEGSSKKEIADRAHPTNMGATQLQSSISAEAMSCVDVID